MLFRNRGKVGGVEAEAAGLAWLGGYIELCHKIQAFDRRLSRYSLWLNESWMGTRSVSRQPRIFAKEAKIHEKRINDSLPR